MSVQGRQENRKSQAVREHSGPHDPTEKHKDGHARRDACPVGLCVLAAEETGNVWKTIHRGLTPMGSEECSPKDVHILIPETWNTFPYTGKEV